MRRLLCKRVSDSSCCPKICVPFGLPPRDVDQGVAGVEGVQARLKVVHEHFHAEARAADIGFGEGLVECGGPVRAGTQVNI